ncbi:hypothetical protein HYX11_01570 [Candidatus Woesearchaeota archaeon]|nr:hypothetical protein [Candidatus Woesearchaeota archaeon]
MTEFKSKAKIFELFEKNVNEITKIRGRPLLVMFYSNPAGRILPCDIKTLERVFIDFLKNKGKE